MPSISVPGAIIGSAVVGAGGALYAGSQNSKAINKASNAQQAAQQQAIDEQRHEFDVTQGNLKPWLDAGGAALNQQRILMGLGATPVAPPTPGGPLSPDQVKQILSDRPDVAAQAQQAIGNGSAQQMGINSPEQFADYWYNNVRQGAGDPYQLAAPDAGPVLTPEQQQQQAIEGLQKGPLYQSLIRNGQNLILANGSATGGLRGGNMQSSLANFGADALTSVIQQQLQSLGGLSGQGANTGGTLGQLGGNNANSISALLQGQGAAQAGGILGSAGARNAGFTSALGDILGGVGGYLGNRGGFGGGGYSTPMALGFTPSAGDPIVGLY